MRRDVWWGDAGSKPGCAELLFLTRTSGGTGTVRCVVPKKARKGPATDESRTCCARWTLPQAGVLRNSHVKRSRNLPAGQFEHAAPTAHRPFPHTLHGVGMLQFPLRESAPNFAAGPQYFPTGQSAHVQQPPSDVNLPYGQGVQDPLPWQVPLEELAEQSKQEAPWK